MPDCLPGTLIFQSQGAMQGKELYDWSAYQQIQAKQRAEPQQHVDGCGGLQSLVPRQSIPEIVKGRGAYAGKMNYLRSWKTMDGCIHFCCRRATSQCLLRMWGCLQEAHIEKLRGSLDSAGDASLQNGLALSIGALKSIPPYGHREVWS